MVSISTNFTVCFFFFKPRPGGYLCLAVHLGEVPLYQYVLPWFLHLFIRLLIRCEPRMTTRWVNYQRNFRGGVGVPREQHERPIMQHKTSWNHTTAVPGAAQLKIVHALRKKKKKEKERIVHATCKSQWCCSPAWWTQHWARCILLRGYLARPVSRLRHRIYAHLLALASSV
jgi:hypothetical protein